MIFPDSREVEAGVGVKGEVGMFGCMAGGAVRLAAKRGVAGGALPGGGGPSIFDTVTEGEEREDEREERTAPRAGRSRYVQ